MLRKTLFLTGIIWLIAISVGCDNTKNKERLVYLPDDSPGFELVTGWYARPDIVAQLVGNDFTPLKVNDKGETAIMLVIRKGKEHFAEGIAAGLIKDAQLIVPVEVPDDFQTPDGTIVQNAKVCPMTIVEKSPWLGNKLSESGYLTYTGQIDLNLEETETQYMVDASLKTANGMITIKGMFDKEGEKVKDNWATFSSKRGLKTYMYGEEKMTLIEDGKGNLKTDGQNIISAMNLDGQPYFLKLFIDYTAAFDFVTKQN